MYFRLKKRAGQHAEKQSDGSIRMYNAKDGELIETDRDLTKIFRGKFEKVAAEEAEALAETKASKKKPQKTRKKQPASTSKEVEEEKTAGDLGEDVTGDFPHAEEEDFKVFQKGKGYFVVEADDPDAPLHEKPLKKKDVEPFVEQYLKG